MHIQLTVADHEQNGFVSLARWRRMTEADVREAVARVGEEISDDMEPDIKTAPFAFILDICDGFDIHDIGERCLPTQIAARLAPDQVRAWLDERPDPDAVISRAIPIIEKFSV